MDALITSADTVVDLGGSGSAQRHQNEQVSGSNRRFSPVVVVIAIQCDVDACVQAESELREKVHEFSQSLLNNFRCGPKHISIHIRPSAISHEEGWSVVQAIEPGELGKNGGSLHYASRNAPTPVQQDEAAPCQATRAAEERSADSTVPPVEQMCPQGIPSDEIRQAGQDDLPDAEPSRCEQIEIDGAAKRQASGRGDKRRDSVIPPASDQGFDEPSPLVSEPDSSSHGTTSPRSSQGTSSTENATKSHSKAATTGQMPAPVEDSCPHDDANVMPHKQTIEDDGTRKPKRKNTSPGSDSEARSGGGTKKPRAEHHTTVQHPLVPAPPSPVMDFQALLVDAIEEGLEAIVNNPAESVHKWDSNINELKPTSHSTTAKSFAMYAVACHQHCWLSTFLHQCEIVLSWSENKRAKKTDEYKKADKMVTVVSVLINTLFTKLKIPSNAYHVLTALSGAYERHCPMLCRSLIITAATSKRMGANQFKYISKKHVQEVGVWTATALANDMRWEALQPCYALDPVGVLGPSYG